VGERFSIPVHTGPGAHPVSCTAIPVIIVATGIVAKSLRKNLEAIPGKISIDSLQQTAILGTSHVKRKELHCET
jgi:hypothetical protein